MRKWLEFVEHCEVVAFEKMVACDQRACVGMSEHIAELAARAPSINRDHDAAQGANREVRDKPLGLVAHQDRDHVTLSDPKRVQPFCKCPYVLRQPCICLAPASPP